MTAVEHAGYAAGMLVLLHIEAKLACSESCFQQIRLLRRPDVGPLLDRGLGDVLYEAAAHFFDDCSNDTLELAIQKSAQCSHHRRRHSRQHHMLVGRPTGQNRRMFAWQGWSEITHALLGPQ